MKREIKPYPLIHPTTICIIGTLIHGEPNYTTVGDIAVAGLNPPLIMVSINQEHNAMKWINEHKTFSISIPPKKLLKKVDYAGMNSSKTVDKSDLFQCTFHDGLPILKEAPIAMIVAELRRVTIKQRVILVCDVLHTFVEDKLVQKNKIDLSTVSSILYGLDNQYYEIGKPIGEGYSEGKKL